MYYGAVDPPGRLDVVAVDISPEELALNPHAARTVVADVAVGLPIPDASADLILSRALLEHVKGVPAAIDHIGSGTEARRGCGPHGPVSVFAVRPGCATATVRATAAPDTSGDARHPRVSGISGGLRSLLAEGAGPGTRVSAGRVSRTLLRDHVGVSGVFRGCVSVVLASCRMGVDGQTSEDPVLGCLRGDSGDIR